MATNSWDRLPKETPKAHLRFTQYLDMGPDRSLRKLARKLDKKPSYFKVLANWSRKHLWPDRTEDYDFYLIEKERIAFEESLIQRRLEHRKTEIDMSKQLFSIAESYLAEVEKTSIDGKDATSTLMHNLMAKYQRTIETGSKIGRLALDMPPKVSHNIQEKPPKENPPEDQLDLSALSIDELTDL